MLKLRAEYRPYFLPHRFNTLKRENRPADRAKRTKKSFYLTASLYNLPIAFSIQK
jgi:hypothetical protein